MTTEKDWIDTWNLFDEKSTGTVSRVDFKHVARSLGRKYTEAEFEEIMKDMGASDVVNREKFIEFMKKPYKGPTEEDLKAALQAFDANETGMLKLSEISNMLTTMGEKMAESEVKLLLSDVKTDAEGRVSIEDFVKFLCTPVPAITPNIQELQRQLAAHSSS